MSLNSTRLFYPGSGRNKRKQPDPERSFLQFFLLTFLLEKMSEFLDCRSASHLLRTCNDLKKVPHDELCTRLKWWLFSECIRKPNHSFLNNVRMLTMDQKCFSHDIYKFLSGLLKLTHLDMSLAKLNVLDLVMDHLNKAELRHLILPSVSMSMSMVYTMLCPNLRSLDLSHVQVEGKDYKSLPQPNLQQLTTLVSPSARLKDLVLLLSTCPNIHHLDLHRVREVFTDKENMKKLLGFMPRLTHMVFPRDQYEEHKNDQSLKTRFQSVYSWTFKERSDAWSPPIAYTHSSNRTEDPEEGIRLRDYNNYQ